jgi:hypothetical protein
MWPWIVVGAIVLLILALNGVFWFLNHIAVASDGSIDMLLPSFLQREPGESYEPTPSRADIVFKSPEPTQEDVPSVEPTPVPTPAPSPSIRAITLHATQLADFETLKPDVPLWKSMLDVNTVLLDFKSENGRFLSKETITRCMELFQEDYRVYALISVYVDDATIRQNYTLAIPNQEGGIWTNVSGQWLNPYEPDTEGVVTDAILSAMKFDFDGIVLQHIAFPTQGNLESINLSPWDALPRTEPVNTLLDAIAALNGNTPIYAVLENDSALSGQEESRFTSQFPGLLFPCSSEIALTQSKIPLITEAPSQALSQKLKQLSKFVLKRENGSYLSQPEPEE